MHMDLSRVYMEAEGRPIGGLGRSPKKRGPLTLLALLGPIGTSARLGASWSCVCFATKDERVTASFPHSELLQTMESCTDSFRSNMIASLSKATMW